MVLVFRTSCALLTLLSFSLMANAGWERVDTGMFAWFHAIEFVDGQIGWTAGSNGTLLKTTDGGNTWTRSESGTKDTILDVRFVNRDNGWMLVESSRSGRPSENGTYLLRTRNGGESWTRFGLGEQPERFVRMLFTGPEKGFLIGEGGITRSLPGLSENIVITTLPSRFLILDGEVLGPSKIVLVGGGGTIILSDDGGAAWRSAAFIGDAPRSKLNAVNFFDNKFGWAVGNGGSIFSTETGGRSWSGQNSNVNEPLLDVKFVDRSVGIAVGDNGIILSTTDGGVHWSREKSGNRHRLERLAFASGKVFAVGFGGTILTSKINARN